MRSTRSPCRNFVSWREQGRQAADWSEWWARTSLSRLGSSESITAIRHLSRPAVQTENVILQFGRHVRSTTEDRKEYSLRMRTFGIYSKFIRAFCGQLSEAGRFSKCRGPLEKVWEGAALWEYRSVVWETYCKLIKHQQHCKREREKSDIPVQTCLWGVLLELTLLYHKIIADHSSLTGNSSDPLLLTLALLLLASVCQATMQTFSDTDHSIVPLWSVYIRPVTMSSNFLPIPSRNFSRRASLTHSLILVT